MPHYEWSITLVLSLYMHRRTYSLFSPSLGFCLAPDLSRFSSFMNLSWKSLIPFMKSSIVDLLASTWIPVPCFGCSLRFIFIQLSEPSPSLAPSLWVLNKPLTSLPSRIPNRLCSSSLLQERWNLSCKIYPSLGRTKQHPLHVIGLGLLSRDHYISS